MDHASTLRASLRNATCDAHRRIDHHPLLKPLLQPDLSQHHYVLVLQAFLDLYAIIQPVLMTALRQIGGDYQLADRITWLQQDLADLSPLGSTKATQATQATQATETSSPLVRCLPLPPEAHGPAVVGALYVIEGSALGGQVIARHIHASLGVDAKCGARFFNGQGEATQQKWQQYWQFATSICSTNDEAAAALAAVTIFDTIERGLNAAWAQACPNHAAQATRAQTLTGAKA